MNKGFVPASPGGLLPPSSGTLPSQARSLLPPSGGAVLRLGSEGGEALVQDMSQAFERAQREAKVLAAQAATFAAEKAPEIRKAAQEAATKVAAFSGERLKEAALSAQAAGSALADPRQRRSGFAVYRWPIVIGFAVIALLGVGGWMLAVNEASVGAKQRVDAFLLQHGLNGAVGYQSVSGSPFGSITLSGVTFSEAGGQMTAKIAELDVSRISVKDDVPTRFSVTARGVEIPLLALLREYPNAATRSLTSILGLSLPPEALDRHAATPSLAAMLGLGYTQLSGNITFTYAFDDTTGTLSCRYSGSFDDLATWDASVEIGGINAATIASLTNAAQNQNPLPALFQGLPGVSPAFLNATLVHARITIDNSGYFARLAQIPSDDLPRDALGFRPPYLPAKGLVNSGFDKAAAQQDQDAVTDWVAHGGSLTMETTNPQPLPLVNSGPNYGGPAFSYWGDGFDFMVDTKLKITN